MTPYVFQFTRDPMRVLPLDEKWFKGISQDAKTHLLSSLSSLEAGRAPTPSFKLYGRTDVGLVDDFFKIVKQKGIEIPEWQLEYEMSRKEKWGPQGGYKPWSELKENFLMYYERPQIITAHIDNNDTIKKYAKLNPKLLSLKDTLQYLQKEDKIQERAAGWRDFNLKKTDPIAKEHALADARSGAWKNSYGYPFGRFQKQKPRIFMPMPYSLMLLEAQYYSQFLRCIQDDLRLKGSESDFTFWADKIGFDPMFDDIVSPLCSKFDPAHFVYIQRDFEKMDTTTGFSQTEHSFIPRLKKAFKVKDGSQADKYLHELFYFGATCPIVTPDGVYTGYRGKASGANTTNGDETASNEDYDHEVTERVYAKAREQDMHVTLVYTGGNGDDGISIWHLQDMNLLDKFKEILLDAAEEAADIFKFRINRDKWHISDVYGLYCQRMVYWKDGKMWNGYPASLILNSIVDPEKEYSPSDWDKDYRDLDIIEKLDNGKNLPYFHELIDFVDNGMKYRLLGKSEAELQRIVDKYETYRALRQDPFNYQDMERRGDITKSPTLLYLLEKRHWKMPQIKSNSKQSKFKNTVNSIKNLLDGNVMIF